MSVGATRNNDDALSPAFTASAAPRLAVGYWSPLSEAGMGALFSSAGWYEFLKLLIEPDYKKTRPAEGVPS